MTIEELDRIYMKRCFTLATKGSDAVKSNPHVGAVIVKDGRIIGEGYHQKFGEYHAERNALASVSSEDRSILRGSTMYISLEPCNHHGKTPPCVDAILESGIIRVVISSLDPNPLMQGRSVALLKSNGIEVESSVLQEEGDELLRRFKANQNSRPFIAIKMAKSANNVMGDELEQVKISGEAADIYSHRSRAHHDAILIGTGTAIIDNPTLTTRNYPGKNPIRVVLDRQQRIPKSHKLLNDHHITWIVTQYKNYAVPNQFKKVLVQEKWELIKILEKLYVNGVCSILIEGGKSVLASIIKANMWDEAIILHSNSIVKGSILAPHISGIIKSQIRTASDAIYRIAPHI